jgi:hypothetical protein
MPVEAICRDVGGMQAQVLNAAALQLSARIHGFTRNNFEAALWKQRVLVKTNAMRNTLHLIPSREFNLYVAALKRSRLAPIVRVAASVGVPPKRLDKMNEWILEALKGGPRTKKDVTAYIRERADKALTRGTELVWNPLRMALAQGTVVHAQERGGEAVFVRTEQWLPNLKRFDEAESQRALLSRYLSAYAPSTRRDFSKWSGIPASEANPLWRSAVDLMTEVATPRGPAWVLREDASDLKNAAPSKEPTIRLLPIFDPFLLGHSETDHLIEPRYYKRVYRSQGWISAVVLVDGQIAGIWNQERNGNSVIVEVVPFRRFSTATRKGIAEESESLAHFLALRSRLRFLPPGSPVLVATS